MSSKNEVANADIKTELSISRYHWDWNKELRQIWNHFSRPEVYQR